MNKQTIGILLSLIIIGLVSIIILRKTRHTHTATMTIGIIQTASHPALDAAKDGFINTLKKELGTGIDFVIQNGQGSIVQLHAIAQSFYARNDIDAIFAIATPAAKAIATIEKNKPIFIAAVTDPHALGLIHPTTNVTGSSDMINVDEFTMIIKQLTPHAKNVGILFNTAEINSVNLTSKMEHSLKQEGLTPIKIGITSEADLASALEVNLPHIDVLITPTDHTVASAINFIAQRAVQAKKPLIVSDNLLIQYGPFAAYGVNYQESGKQAALIALEVLQKGKNPSEIEIAKPMHNEIFINRQTLDALNLSIPDNIRSKTTLINVGAS